MELPGVNRADRRPRNQDGESRGDGWRNLGAGRQRRLGLLAQPAADGGDVPRAARHSLARDFGRSVAADRDLGVIFEGELFITGRIKELLVVDGANHYPEDIEATIQEITGGRVVAIAVPDDRTEKLVTIIELMKRGRTDEEEKNRLRTVKREVASAISRSHRLRVADVVMVAPGSIPVTTSGKVRRSASVERYLHHEFSRLDAMA